jgi:hypothetical protein
MTYARPKRNYRSTKKQVEQSPAKGTFVSNKDKPKFAAIGAGIALMLFMLGLLVGAIAARD